jgi:hypothetical protein
MVTDTMIADLLLRAARTVLTATIPQVTAPMLRLYLRSISAPCAHVLENYAA